MENKDSIILCYIGGILMVLNPIGLMILDFTFYSYSLYYESTEMFNFVLFLITGFLIIIGGIAVIYGAFIIAKDRSRLGIKIIRVAVLIIVIFLSAFMSLFSILGLTLTVIAYRSLDKYYKSPR